jgi:hypothetical protein
VIASAAITAKDIIVPRTNAAKTKPVDPLEKLGKLADAIDDAVQSAKTQPGSSDPGVPGNHALIRPLEKIAYSSSYALSYGIAFPVMMIAMSVSANNPAVRGMADGARAARQKAESIKMGTPK